MIVHTNRATLRKAIVNLAQRMGKEEGNDDMIMERLAQRVNEWYITDTIDMEKHIDLMKEYDKMILNQKV